MSVTGPSWPSCLLCGFSLELDPVGFFVIEIAIIGSHRPCCRCRDHFLARFRDILAFFCKKSHQNSWSEKKNGTLNFSHFAPLSSYFAHAVHFQTIGLLCLTGFWIIVAPKFITHTAAGNHLLICIIEKLYRKNSLSVSGLSKRFLDRYLESAKHVRRLGGGKKKERKVSTPVGMQHVKVSCLSITQLDWSGHTLLPWFGWRSNTRRSWAPWSPYSAVCILLRARRNEKEMKVKPATSFKIIYSICW